jgi:PAS domain S-box-containing protein
LQERSAAGLRDTDGNLVARIGACLDINERKSAEYERSRAAERYRTLARLVRGYLFEGQLLPTGGIEFTWADDEFGAIFGCERAEVNRRGWHSFVDARDQVSAVERLSGLARGNVVEIELRIIATTGERRWLRMAAEPLRDAETGRPSAVIGMAEDITHRKVLMEHMFDAIHTEQQRIGRDLHDGLGQVLTGVSLLLTCCRTLALRGEAVEPARFVQLIELVTGAIETTRGLAYGLAPGTKEYGGLLFALEALVQQSRGLLGLTIDLVTRLERRLNLDTTTSDHLYRIIQEAVANVARHAHAKHVLIGVTVSRLMLEIEVSDDGVGIPRASKLGFGMRSMRYRADSIGAALTVDRIEPQGTKLSIRLPLVEV